MSLAAALGYGFLLGLRHALDADHFATVAALIARKRDAGRLAAAWGLGHGVTVLFVGGALVLSKSRMPSRVVDGLELGVGIMLIVLGVLSAWGLLSSGVTAHSHRHGDEHGHPERPGRDAEHEHAHLHLPPQPDGIGRALTGAPELARAAAVGILHGLAGSSAIAIVAAASLPTPTAAALYLAVFGLGTTLGMLSLSLAMQRSLSAVAAWWKPAERGLAAAIGALSVALGAWIVLERLPR